MADSDKNKIPIICGPTASGKTAVGVKLAQLLDAEIISADSRLVYRKMDIGTAKPSKEEKENIPHHLIDIREPNEDFTVAEFKELAYEKIGEILGRGKQVIVVGGTGLYIRALTENPGYQEISPNEEVRNAILDEIAERGADEVYQEIREIDPEAAAQIHPNNIPRLVRALEVIRLTGRKFSDGVKLDRGREEKSIYDFKVIGLNWDREILYDRINARVDKMIEVGWVDEVRGLLESGLSGNEKPLQGLGYRDIVSVVRDGVDLEMVVETIKRDTRRFAKRQMTWYRGMSEIEWTEMSSEIKPEQVAEKILRKLNEQNTEI